MYGMERRRVAARNRRARDAGLRRVASLTRWSLAGALTATGVFAGLAAQVGRGAAAATKTTTKSPAASSTRAPDTRRIGRESGESEVPETSDDAGSGASSASTGSNVSNAAPATTPLTQPPSVAPVASGGPVSVVSGAS